MHEGEEEDDDCFNMFVVHKGKINSDIEKPKQVVLHKQEEAKAEIDSQGVPHCRPRSRAPTNRESLIRPDQLAKQTISSQLLVDQSADSIALAQSITCPMCLNLLKVPYQECQVCSNGFCEPCMEAWWKKQPGVCIFKCEKAQFKQIKRSNTLNALLQTLRVKCQYCAEEQPIAQLHTHILKYCQKVPEACRFCAQQHTRDAIDRHQAEDCPERVYECSHCGLAFLAIEQELHQASCPEKLIPCSHELCNKSLERKNLAQHQKSCGKQIVKCFWCKVSMTKEEVDEHGESCEARMVNCNWCQQGFGVREILSHQCQKRRETCRLCREQVLVTGIQKHRIDCMFESMVELKHRNNLFQEENQRLKEKVSLLEGIIEQAIESRESNAAKVVQEMREQDRRAAEKDLQRIDYSMKSVEKLRKEQFSSHLKIPHFSQSWCPICRDLQRKFKAMLEPLIASRKTTLQKLSELQRLSQTPS